MRTVPARRLMLALALAVLLPRGVAAQQNGSHTLLPGDTVRVHAPSLHPGVIQGELLLYRGDSLGIRDASTGTAYQFPLSAIRRLEKNEGLDRRRSVRRWATAGLFLGSALGLVSGPLIATTESGAAWWDPRCWRGWAAARWGWGWAPRAVRSSRATTGSASAPPSSRRPPPRPR